MVFSGVIGVNILLGIGLEGVNSVSQEGKEVERNYP
jgi:hypothetical protein